MAAPSAFLPPTLLLLLFFFFPRQSLCLKFRPDRLIVADPSPETFTPSSAPAPTSGGDLPKLPSEGHSGLNPVGHSYDPLLPGSEPTPSAAPSSETGGAIPFINSNPAVPLPTGITDTATILPLASPGGGDYALTTGKGSLVQIQLMWAVFLMIFSFWAST